MGRHSAPDDEDEGDVLVAAAPVAVRPRPGRHARPDDDEDAVEAGQDVIPTTRLQVDGSPPAQQTAAPDAEPDLEPPPAARTRIGRGSQSTAADLALLRERSDVRARVIAAVIAPFVIYTVAMYLAGSVRLYFIWVWLPLVTAGVVAGSILDAAHRRRTKNTGT